MKKRIILFVLSLLVLVNPPITMIYASSTVASPLERQIVKAVGKNAIDRMETQKPAVDAYKTLCEYYRNSKGDVVFPDDYGGEYIIDDVLHIYLTDLSKDSVVRYKKILADHEGAFFFEKVSYSYNYLLSLRTTAERLLGNAVRGSYVDTKNNCVVIETAPEATKKCTEMISMKSFPTNSILIQEAKSISPDATIHGGDAIYSMYQSNPFTIAVCGFYNDQPAILTSGHGLTQNQTLGITSTNSAFSVDYLQYSSGEFGDYAICRVTNPSTNPISYQMTYYNNTYLPVDGVYDVEHLARGMTLIKYGQNTHFSLVNIASTGVTVTDTNSVTIKGLVQTNIVDGNSQGGDSGGPYFTYTYGECTFAGIHNSSYPNTSVRTVTYFTPFSLVSSDFSIYLNP